MDVRITLRCVTVDTDAGYQRLLALVQQIKDECPDSYRWRIWSGDATAGAVILWARGLMPQGQAGAAPTIAALKRKPDTSADAMITCVVYVPFESPQLASVSPVIPEPKGMVQ